jgi:ABC-type multidrug transport system ATPase subunit
MTVELVYCQDLLTWHNVGKAYGRRRLFSGLTGELCAGCGLVITGPNGAGKSTLLKIFVGLVRPDNGTIERCGSIAEIGYAAPDQLFYSELSALDNIRFVVNLRGPKRSDADLLAVLEAVGIARSAGKPVGAFSTGMIQRLRIACALAVGHAMLVLDEPTLGLDSEGMTLVENLIVDAAEGGTGPKRAVVIATNEPLQAERFKTWGWASYHVGA